MNERIEKLAEEAGLDVYPISITGSTEELEKFAELIVRECVGMLDDEDDYGPYSTGVRSAAYRIKKHFGVEE